MDSLPVAVSLPQRAVHANRQWVIGDYAILLQFAGSLLAILALAWIAARLKLGSDAPIHDAQHARELADEIDHGFDATEVAVSDDGRAALLRDVGGRVMVLRRHGAHFAGRILGPRAAARIEGDRLVVDTAEVRFGAVELSLGNGASAWVQAISAIGSSRDA